jgi:probable rRNA maturation factor
VTVDVLLTDKTNSEFTSEFLNAVSKKVFEMTEASFEEAEISVLITNYATDVLSFPMCEYPLDDGGMLGDIVISIDTAKKQAEENEIALNREFAFLYIHGLLHLLGYDHETSQEDEEEMFDLQEAILREVISAKLAE